MAIADAVQTSHIKPIAVNCDEYIELIIGNHRHTEQDHSILLYPTSILCWTQAKGPGLLISRAADLNGMVLHVIYNNPMHRVINTQYGATKEAVE